MKKSLIVFIISLFFSCQPGYKNDTTQADTISADTTLIADTSVPVEAWTINSFVDEFGEPGKDKFVQTTTYGTFSNSATANSYLKAEILITTKNAGIFLHEYHDNEPAQKFIGTGTIRLKNQDAKDITIYSYSEWSRTGGLLISDDNYKKLKAFILNSTGAIKVVVYDEYSSVYNFSFDISGFANNYRELDSLSSKKK